jgi:hypothetical protein
MGVPAPPWPDLRRSGRRGRPHSRRRPHFSFAALVAGSRSRDARRYNLGGALAEQGLVPTPAARPWRAGGLRAGTTRGRAGEARLEAHPPSPDLAIQYEHEPPPQLPVSAAWRGFRLQALLPRSFHRATKQFPASAGAGAAVGEGLAVAMVGVGVGVMVRESVLVVRSY